MNYDGATGWLIGESNRGLQAMFVMMNEARLGVGVQGLALSEVAYQNAAAYAKERLQGRALTRREGAGQAGRSDHRPSRRAPHADDDPRLQRGRPRAACLWTALQADVAHRSADAEERQAAEDRLGLMTPVIKGVLTDIGFANTRPGPAGVRRPRLHRRMGHGAVRARCPHRHDLRGRQRHPGARPRRPQAAEGRRPRLAGFFGEVAGFLKAERGRRGDCSPSRRRSRRRSATCSRPPCGSCRMRIGNPDNAGAGSTDYMHLFGLVALGYMWARIAEAALAEGRGGRNGVRAAHAAPSWLSAGSSWSACCRRPRPPRAHQGRRRQP